MKKFCYLLSIAGHAMVLLVALAADFPITIQPEPPRVVVVRIAEPPLPLAGSLEAMPFAGSGQLPPAGGPAGAGGSAGTVASASTGLPPSRGGLSFPATGGFSLSASPHGSFRLAPVGKSPDPWAVPIGPEAPPRPLRYSANAYSPMAARSGPGGSSVPGGVFLLPFDIQEKAVAAWTEVVLSRIERNWTVPTSALYTFSGQVQITLTIEKNGRSRALAVDGSSLPDPASQSALYAVQASLPLPPLPENIAGETFAFTFVFVFNG